MLHGFNVTLRCHKRPSCTAIYFIYVSTYVKSSLLFWHRLRSELCTPRSHRIWPVPPEAREVIERRARRVIVSASTLFVLRQQKHFFKLLTSKRFHLRNCSTFLFPVIHLNHLCFHSIFLPLVLFSWSKCVVLILLEDLASLNIKIKVLQKSRTSQKPRTCDYPEVFSTRLPPDTSQTLPVSVTLDVLTPLWFIMGFRRWGQVYISCMLMIIAWNETYVEKQFPVLAPVFQQSLFVRTWMSSLLIDLSYFIKCKN